MSILKENNAHSKQDTMQQSTLAKTAVKGKLYNISPQLCLKVYPKILSNADKTFSAAVLLKDNGFYGSAIPVATASLEEFIKAIILQMDGLGFDFRNTPGTHRFFNDHVIRHVTAGILLCVYVVGKDLLDLLNSMIADPLRLAAFTLNEANLETMATRLKGYVQRKAGEMKSEYRFFTQIENMRQLGFYCEYPDGLHSPEMISKDQCEKTFEKFEKIRRIIKEFSNAMAQKDQKEEVQRMILLLKENQFYQKLAEQLSGVRSETLFDRFDEFLGRMEHFEF